MRDEPLLVVLVPVEQHDESLLEALQEMLVTKQALTQQMRRYHLWTGHVEREVEQIQHEIQRSVVRQIEECHYVHGDVLCLMSCLLSAPRNLFNVRERARGCPSVLEERRRGLKSMLDRSYKFVDIEWLEDNLNLFLL